MAEQRRGSDGAYKGDQIRHDVVDRSDKTPIDDVGAATTSPHANVTERRNSTMGESLYCAASRTSAAHHLVPAW